MSDEKYSELYFCNASRFALSSVFCNKSLIFCSFEKDMSWFSAFSIGRAVAYDFVKEGASVVIVYYDEKRDAMETAERIEQLGGKCLLLCGDLKDPCFVEYCIDKTIERLGKLDVLVNNHAMQFVQRNVLDISHEQLEFIFRNNVFSFFYLIQYALPHMQKGGTSQYHFRYGI